MTAFQKYPVGNKQFVIEWNFPAGGSEIEGDRFECADCEPISIFGVAAASAETRIAFSNHSEPETYRTSLLVEDVFFSPTVGTLTGPGLIPPVRYIWPLVGAGSGNVRLSILFREI